MSTAGRLRVFGSGMDPVYAEMMQFLHCSKDRIPNEIAILQQVVAEQAVSSRLTNSLEDGSVMPSGPLE